MPNKTNASANKIYRFKWNNEIATNNVGFELLIIPSWDAGSIDFDDTTIYQDEPANAIIPTDSSFVSEYNDGLPIGLPSQSLTVSFDLNLVSQNLINVLLNPFQLDESYNTAIDLTFATTNLSYTQKFSFGNTFILKIRNKIYYIGTQTNKQEQSFSSGVFTAESEMIYKSIASNINAKVFEIFRDENTPISRLFGYDYKRATFEKWFYTTDNNTHLYLHTIGQFNGFLTSMFSNVYQIILRNAVPTFGNAIFYVPIVYQQRTDNDYSRGSAILNRFSDVYLISAITNQSAVSRDSNNKLLGGGFVAQIVNDYKSVWDFCQDLASNSLRKWYIEFQDNLNIVLNQLNTYGSTGSSYVLTQPNKLRNYEVILNGNLKNGVEVVPNEKLDESLSKFTSNRAFGYSDERSTIAQIYTNVPSVNDKIGFTTISGITRWASLTIQNSALYYLDSLGFPIRIHESLNIPITSGVSSDTLLGVNFWAISPNTQALILRQQQLLGVAIETGVYKITAESFMRLFGDLRQLVVNFETNVFEHILETGDVFDGRWLLESQRFIELNLSKFDFMNSDKQLFDNANKEFILVASEMDLQGNTNVTLISKNV